ncbi:hypothetical protein GALL_526000 [mine drainage metagenome]|uniref:Uncharacterized protein n=1 Tax=mine drainage metagenome TaxID=410659 RepID=A0A1J5PDD7_9ZZZZ
MWLWRSWRWPSRSSLWCPRGARRTRRARRRRRSSATGSSVPRRSGRPRASPPRQPSSGSRRSPRRVRLHRTRETSPTCARTTGSSRLRWMGRSGRSGSVRSPRRRGRRRTDQASGTIGPRRPCGWKAASRLVARPERSCRPRSPPVRRSSRLPRSSRRRSDRAVFGRLCSTASGAFRVPRTRTACSRTSPRCTTSRWCLESSTARCGRCSRPRRALSRSGR